MNQIAVSEDLLTRVAAELSRALPATDRMMLTRWKVLSICQHFHGQAEPELMELCQEALEAFVADSQGDDCNRALDRAGAALKLAVGATHSVLPTISAERRLAVSTQLNETQCGGTDAIHVAVEALPRIREQMRASSNSVVLPGIRHRFELVAEILTDIERSLAERVRAASVVLYVEEMKDVIPDNLGVIGMLDDDYALRIVLDELLHESHSSILHWSEKISLIWDDLPFLQGVNLQRDGIPIHVTWLDRVNSYFAYAHALSGEQRALVLLQPSIACSPLHSIVTLIGLSVLDAMTSSKEGGSALRIGQTYEIDGLFVLFDGCADPPTPGWLRLRLRNGVLIQPPGLADRMIPVPPHRLSLMKEFGSRASANDTDPIQRFFQWDGVVGTASISSRIAFVASRHRALEILDGVESNGVQLLDHGLVRFVGIDPVNVETHGTLILVVPSLNVVRQLVEAGIQLQAVFVDGYEKLNHGRHELPFLLSNREAIPLIDWSPAGYYPAVSPAWLPSHKRLEVSGDDLASLLELDGPSTDVSQMSLWEAATGCSIQSRLAPETPAEVNLVASIDSYLQNLRTSVHLPEYWQYSLAALGRTLRILITATPAEWSEIRRFANEWSSFSAEKWSTLKPSAINRLSSLRAAQDKIVELLSQVKESVNSRAASLDNAITPHSFAVDPWYFVCDLEEQSKVSTSFFRSIEAKIQAVRLRDLAVCESCIVTGWINSSFARRLWAHTPRSIIALVNEEDQKRWGQADAAHRRFSGQSYLDAVGGLKHVTPSPASSMDQEEGVLVPVVRLASEDGESAPCIFLTVAGESEAKILPRDAHVVVEEGDMVGERLALRLKPSERVILGVGANRWSPADEFTAAVVQAVERSQPEIISSVKEWRRALKAMADARYLTTTQVRDRLATVGVKREIQTVEGWLETQRASPIAPRGVRIELAAIWPLIEEYARQSLDEVSSACSRLRNLRLAAGRALLRVWKGGTTSLEVDEAWVADLVTRLRREVKVYEIEAITLGEVPRAMLGWWVPTALTMHVPTDQDVAITELED